MTIKSVIIRKRTLGLIALTILGLGLLGWGWTSDRVTHWVKQATGNKGENNITMQVNNPDGLKVDLIDVPGTKEVTDENLTEENKNDSEFYVEYRLERERMRGQQVEYLREIINIPESSAETRQKAQEQLLVISNNLNKKMEVENLIRAKGFKECAVFLQNQAATIVVQADKLSPDEAARIADMVSRSTGVPLKGVVIIPKT